MAVASPGHEIRVAQGTYRSDEDAANPTGTGNDGATVQLISGVALGEYSRNATLELASTAVIDSTRRPNFELASFHRRRIVMKATRAEGNQVAIVVTGCPVTGSWGNR